MDNRAGKVRFSANISSSIAFGSCSTITTVAGYQADKTVRRGSLLTSNLCSFPTKGTKRKWGDFIGGESLINASLSLGLGCSSNSSDSSKQNSATACSMSSAKETGNGSTMDLDLKFQLSLGNENAPSSNKHFVAAPKELESEPKCDLQLSLSVGPSKSTVTNAFPASTQYHDILETSMNFVSVPIVDEGSTSSRWKRGSNLLPYLYASEMNIDFATKHMIQCSSNQPQVSDLIPKTVQTQKHPVASTSRVACPQQRSSSKTCQFQGCRKGARGASRLCIAHGGGRRCQKEGCSKGAEGKTIFCKAHGGGRRCQHLGCTKSAEGRTNYCIAHGGGRRCSFEGCAKAARGKSGRCIRHGGGKRCRREGCKKSAEGHSGLCISHGGGRRCQYPECTKGAQGSTLYCKAHGGGKRCTFFGCTKGAEGSTPFCKGHGGGKRCSFPDGCTKSVHGGTQFCVAHGGGKRCAAPECTRSARGRTNFCVRHGGGKRCKFEGCGKSAQGSTDFCKAHGGGKRCSWGQLGSYLGAGHPPCDRFATGKIGLCTAHTASVGDHCVHGGYTLRTGMIEFAPPSNSEKMKEVVVQENPLANVGNGRDNLLGWTGFDKTKWMHPASTPHSTLVSLPEGRVHGGSLMAQLASSGSPRTHTGGQGEGSSTSKQGIMTYPLPRKWL
ncbi:uncharacterized protein [Typha latifolia]|uniref:uncharacterized protein isoform X1 n=1 Tax=Typha latifolia TaxID=4733 RepID=UPI003C2FD47C